MTTNEAFKPDLWICEKKTHLPEHDGATGYYYYEPVERYTSAISEPVGWLPIESVPLKGEVLLSRGKNGVCTWTFFGDGTELDHRATHWMPLPKPPIGEK